MHIGTFLFRCVSNAIDRDSNGTAPITAVTDRMISADTVKANYCMRRPFGVSIDET